MKSMKARKISSGSSYSNDSPGFEKPKLMDTSFNSTTSSNDKFKHKKQCPMNSTVKDEPVADKNSISIFDGMDDEVNVSKLRNTNSDKDESDDDIRNTDSEDDRQVFFVVPLLSNMRML